MSIKFDDITFNIKDLIFICGLAGGWFTFYQSIDNRFDAFELKIEKTINQNEINNVKINARIDGLKTSQKRDKKIFIFNQPLAVCNSQKPKIKPLKDAKG